MAFAVEGDDFEVTAWIETKGSGIVLSGGFGTGDCRGAGEGSGRTGTTHVQRVRSLQVDLEPFSQLVQQRPGRDEVFA